MSKNCYLTQRRKWKMAEIKNITRAVEGYKKQASDSKKKEWVENNIYLERSYIPYVEKMAFIKNIVDSTSFNTVVLEDGSTTIGNTYKKNGAMQYLMYVMVLIDKYTNIDIVFGDKDLSLMQQYDCLKESGLLEIILGMIPSSEMDEMKILLSVYNEDTYTNYGTLQAMISNLIESAKQYTAPFMDELNKYIANAENK